MKCLSLGICLLICLVLVSDSFCETFLNCRSNRLLGNGSEHRYKSLEDYSNDMCSQCYYYIVNIGIKEELLIRVPAGNGTRVLKPYSYLKSSRSGCLCETWAYLNATFHRQRTVCANDYCLYPSYFQNYHFSTEDPLMSTFNNRFSQHVFKKCCEDAVTCCKKLSNATLPEGDLHCHSTWDGWDCWDNAKADTTLTKQCPLSSMQSQSRELPDCLKGNALKKCTKNGTWYRSPETNKETTDYRDKTLREIYLRLALNVVSLLLVLLSCAIFVGYKQYQVMRVKVHLNFFVSLLLTSLGDMLLHSVVRRRHLDPFHNVLNSNENWCIFITVFAKISRLTAYCWMMNEGIYLHKLIVHAFHEQTRTLPFYLVGWVLPAIAIVPYCAVHSLSKYNSKCWIESMGDLEWLHYPLPMFCLIINTCLLGNIVRVLYTKMRTSPLHFRAALKSTIFLTPTFGIHYMFYVTKGNVTETCQTFLSLLFYLGIAVDCLQGATVAAIFCLLNPEVHSMVRRTFWRRFRATAIFPEEHNLVDYHHLQRKEPAGGSPHETL